MARPPRHNRDDTGAAERTARDETTVPMLAPESLARTLRAVAAELERDPALARRLAAAISIPGDVRSPEAAAGVSVPPAEAEPPHASSPAFKPKLITGLSPDLGAGVPDPFVLHGRLGEAGLRATLNELRLGSLRAIVREHGLDPTGKLSRQNDAARLREVILSAVAGHRRS